MKIKPISKHVRGGDLKNGMTVWLQGRQFIVTDLTMEISVGFLGTPNHSPSEVVRFTGVCTAHENNNDIINTGYNGARYGSTLEHLWVTEIQN